MNNFIFNLSETSFVVMLIAEIGLWIALVWCAVKFIILDELGAIGKLISTISAIIVLPTIACMTVYLRTNYRNAASEQIITTIRNTTGGQELNNSQIIDIINNTVKEFDLPNGRAFTGDEMKYIFHEITKNCGYEISEPMQIAILNRRSNNITIKEKQPNISEETQ